MTKLSWSSVELGQTGARTVLVPQKKHRCLWPDVQFVEWGGTEEVDDHLEIAVHSAQSANCYGSQQTDRVARSGFRTTATGDAGTVVRIPDPRSDFHIYICSNDGTECSFAGNFVYRGREIFGDNPGWQGSRVCAAGGPIVRAAAWPSAACSCCLPGS